MITPEQQQPPGMEKIEHLVILMMENRSFDHYFGALSLDTEYPHKSGIEGFPSPLPKVPDKSGTPVEAYNLGDFYSGYPDPPHGPIPQTTNFNKGKMDGFVINYEKELSRIKMDPTKIQSLKSIPMGYYDRDALPVLYLLADQFTVCDHWFSSVLSSTWPNRKYLHSGKRDVDNDTQTLPNWPGFDTVPMWNALEDWRDNNKNRLTWKNYFCDLPFMAFWYKFAFCHAQHNFAGIDEFVSDCQADRLPTVSIIDPPFSLADDHPSHDVRMGQKFIGLIVDALTNSESWSRTALIITYDENGGFYDHVAPPPAPEQNPVDTPLGFRVPTVIISPYTPSGVCKVEFDHTSVMKSIHSRWAVPFPAQTYGNLWELSKDIWTNCFDFNTDPRPPGIFTPDLTTNLAYKNLTWESASSSLIESPIGDLEAFMERIFILPGLKQLDKRSQLHDLLAKSDSLVAKMKSPA